MVSLCKLINVFYVVPKIFLVLMVTLMLQAKINLYISNTRLKTPKLWNGVGNFCSVYIQYIHLENIVSEAYCNRDNRDLLKYIRVVHRGVNQCYIVLYHGGF